MSITSRALRALRNGVWDAEDNIHDVLHVEGGECHGQSAFEQVLSACAARLDHRADEVAMAEEEREQQRRWEALWKRADGTTIQRFDPTGPGEYQAPEECSSTLAAFSYLEPCALGKGHAGEHVYDATRAYSVRPYEAR